MIDFVKVYYRDKDKFESYVLNEKNFPDLNAVLEYHTGDVKYPYTTKLDTMRVQVSDKTGYVKNSIHKLRNYRKSGEEHNYDDFSYTEICDTIDYLADKIPDVSETRLSQLEFGLNVIIDRQPEQIVRRSFLLHRYKKGVERTFQGPGLLKEFVHNNYTIKVYDKGQQYGLEKNILRFELKFTKAIEFNSLGVFNLSSLKDKATLRKLFLKLMQRFEEIVIIDDFDSKFIEIDKYNDLMRYTNDFYWAKEFKGKHQELKKRQRDKFQAMLVENSLLQTKFYLKELLYKKFIYLINH